MRFGANNPVPAAAPLRDWNEFNWLAETSGLEHIAFGDVQTRILEMSVNLTMLAVRTSSLRLGTAVSNPLTRHPGVMAGLWASLQRVSGGRAWFGVATGNSSLRNLGLAPASLAELEEYVGVFRDLIRTGRATYRGRECRLPWAPDLVPEGVPVYVAANGPKSLRLAGRMADGVIVGGGIASNVVESSLRHLEAGAKEGGRTLADLDVWFQAAVTFAASEGDARTHMRSVLAAMASRNFRFTLEGKGVPDDLVPAIRRLEREYRYESHAEHDGFNADLIDRLGLTEFLAQLWLVGGPPERVAQRFVEAQAVGVTNVHVQGFASDPLDFLRQFAGRVMPHVPSDDLPPRAAQSLGSAGG